MNASRSDPTAAPNAAAANIDRNRDLWQRLAQLHPALVSAPLASEHCYRDEPWVVFYLRNHSQYFRASETAYRIIQRCDGKRSLASIAVEVEKSSGATVDPNELAALIQQLLAAGLLETTSAESTKPREAFVNWSLRQALKPLSMSFPLLDPDPWLARMACWLNPVFRRNTLWILAVFFAFVVMLAASSQADIESHWNSRFLDPSSLLWLWLLYPLVKALHELGHGISARFFGAEIHEMGIRFLVFIPIPYVDASASIALADKRRRMLVAGAGIVVELALSAAAFLFWLWLDPGLLRDLAFYVAFIGVASSLLFNANPLLRFDGYFVLSDWLEIPNLGSRSSRLLSATLRNKVFALAVDTESLPTRQRLIMMVYALAAACYRLVICLAIAMMVAGQFFFLGTALALVLIVAQFLMPMMRGLSNIWRDSMASGLRKRTAGILGGTGIALMLFLFVLPISNSTYSRGVINLVDEMRIVNSVDGFVTNIHVGNGDQVSQGQLLFELENPDLSALHENLYWQRQALEVRYRGALGKDPVLAERLKQERIGIDAALKDAADKRAALRILSPVSGRLIADGIERQQGRWLERGTQLAFILNRDAVNVQVAVPQSQLERMRAGVLRTDLVLDSRPWDVLTAESLREVPRATMRLPSAAFGSVEGGPIAVDLSDPGGRTAMAPFFLYAIELPLLERGQILARYAKVRFVHRNQPLGIRWLTSFRQVLISELGI